jgi:hypothetical protein
MVPTPQPTLLFSAMAIPMGDTISNAATASLFLMTVPLSLVY